MNERDEFKERVRARTPAGEALVAQGTAAERRTLDDQTGVPETYLVLTDQRLLISRMSRSLPADEEIALDAIGRWADGLQGHRYFVAITHPAIVRLEHARPGGPGWMPIHVPFIQTSGKVTRTETILRFSHRNTAVARALRAALTARDIPHDELVLPQPTREERTRGSRVFARKIDAADVPKRVASRIEHRRE